MTYKWYVLTIVSEIGINHFIYFGTAIAAFQFASAEILPMYEGIDIIGVTLEDQETFMRGNIFLEGLFNDED